MNIKDAKDFRISETLDHVIALEGLYEIKTCFEHTPRNVWMGLLVWLKRGNYGVNEINNSDVEFSSYDDFKKVVNNISPKTLDWGQIVQLNYSVSK